MTSTHGDAVSARVRRAPPQLATSLSASVSSGRAVLGAAKHKNWRANYLRALNIYTPDVDPARVRFAADAAVARQRSRSSTAPGVPAVPSAPVAETVGTSSRRRGFLGHRINGDDLTGNTRRSNSSANSSNSSGNRSAGSAVSRLLGRHHSRSNGSNNSNANTASGSPPDEKNGAYVFGMRSHLFRARRPTSRNDYLVVDRVSAPIEIPTSQTPTHTRTPHASERSSNCKSPTSVDCEGRSKPQYQQQQQPAQLLSWEEPSVMMSDSGWPLEVDKPSANRFYDRESNQFESNDLPFVANRRPPTHPVRTSGEFSNRFARPCGIGIPEEECEDTEDDETLDLDRVDDSRDDEDDDDDIFKMEELGSEDSDSAGPRQQQLRRTSSGRYRSDPFVGGDHSAMSAGRRRGSLPTPTSARRRGNQDEADEFRALSESFVPPHQMVERDCFSLGLRDELKRRPLRT